MTEPTTHQLSRPGVTLTYDVRGDVADATPDRPVLVLVGSPMGAAGFTTLASHFTDRPVVTYDPRGVERSVKDEPASESTPEEHADDIAAIIDALGVEHVDLMGSSGGAVNGLALVARHPGRVRTLVAHEPPAVVNLPDAEWALAANDDIGATYQKEGMGPAMAKFIALVMQQGEITPAYLEQPAPDPAMFGLPAEDDGDRTDALLGQNNRSCVRLVPDVEAIRASGTRVVVARGVESGEQLAARSAGAVAALLGQEAVSFPSDHGGFLGGEYGQQGDPDAFASRLREVLDGA
ncbi:alpha/beta fold hydrolase [Nocardioides iriomotensis]|uniref:Alpha/beta hydrolase n=1 Tax=Nocardioides iriomotensis TaxID=715784 RepID=A0A4Q5J9I1_9ACTN|nr:alpha/beta hydrolase [Nocardioides iriomotensis]RYU15263.1 alpha/beta hydrolase [Nocardioides iriomotensis]